MLPQSTARWDECFSHVSPPLCDSGNVSHGKIQRYFSCVSVRITYSSVVLWWLFYSSCAAACDTWRCVIYTNNLSLVTRSKSAHLLYSIPSAFPWMQPNGGAFLRPRGFFFLKLRCQNRYFMVGYLFLICLSLPPQEPSSLLTVSYAALSQGLSPRSQLIRREQNSPSQQPQNLIDLWVPYTRCVVLCARTNVSANSTFAKQDLTIRLKTPGGMYRGVLPERRRCSMMI